VQERSQLTGIMKTNTDRKSRKPSSCVSTVLYIGSWSDKLVARSAVPRINKALTMMEPRIEA